MKCDEYDVFKDDKTKTYVCCICGKECYGYGNNAEPVKSGRCCDRCNMEVVIPARIESRW